MLCTTVHLLLIFINRRGVIFYKIITFFIMKKFCWEVLERRWEAKIVSCLSRKRYYVQ